VAPAGRPAHRLGWLLTQPLAPLDIASSGCLAACCWLTAPLDFAWLPLGALPDSRVPSTPAPESPQALGFVPQPLHPRCWCACSGHLLLGAPASSQTFWGGGGRRAPAGRRSSRAHKPKFLVQAEKQTCRPGWGARREVVSSDGGLRHIPSERREAAC
jgi:hypothetical protein